jgi:hypothetical protein
MKVLTWSIVPLNFMKPGALWKNVTTNSDSPMYLFSLCVGVASVVTLHQTWIKIDRGVSNRTENDEMRVNGEYCMNVWQKKTKIQKFKNSKKMKIEIEIKLNCKSRKQKNKNKKKQETLINKSIDR